MPRPTRDIVITALTASCLTLVIAVPVSLFIQHAFVPTNNESNQSILHQPHDSSSRQNAGKTYYETNQVKNTITKNNGQIRDCYIAFLASNPKVTDGKLLVDWEINRDGSVRKSEVVTSEIGSDILHSCVISKIRTWEFPSTGVPDPVYTSFTFVFKKDESIQQAAH